MEKLGVEFYQRQDTVQLARELIGKIIVTRFDSFTTSARIVETEAYNGIKDRASHAFGGRHTNRTRIMYLPGGTIYVYLCYGIHHLFNVVTNVADEPHAVLIRSAVGMKGMDTILNRLGKSSLKHDLLKGPGVVSKGLGITIAATGTSLLDNQIALHDDGYEVNTASLIATPRIGVDYAGEDALLPYRFVNSTTIGLK
ncbi:MAG: DNA-3-methyladenine glycosylase [Chitinophagaceae bacterium]